MRILLASFLLIFGTSASLACGNPLLWAMLFAKVPQAKVVYQAELAARADGLITARAYDARPGQAYHQWSKAWILDLAHEMQPSVDSVLADGEALTILLADEVAAIRFVGGKDPAFIPASGLREIAQYDLITSINALKNVWRDGLSFSESKEQNLAWASESGNHLVLSSLFETKR